MDFIPERGSSGFDSPYPNYFFLPCPTDPVVCVKLSPDKPYVVFVLCNLVCKVAFATHGNCSSLRTNLLSYVDGSLTEY